MLNIKCFHCGKSFALDDAVAASWLQEHQDENPTHYSAQCHFCRRTIKVPVAQIRRQRRAAPAPETDEG